MTSLAASARSRDLPSPLFWAALAFGAGIAIARYAWRPPLWWLAPAIVVAACVLALVQRHARTAWICALALFVALGALAFAGRAASEHLPPLDALDDHEVVALAHIVRVQPAMTGAPRTSFDVETESLTELLPGGEREEPQNIHTGVRVSVYSRENFAAALSEEEDDEGAAELDATPDFHYGERVELTGRLRLPRNFGNSGAFDYRGYLLDRGIAAQLAVRSDQVQRLAGDGGSRAGRWRSVIRQSLLRHIAMLWRPADAALLSAMLVSERSLLERGTRIDFQRSGIYHLLVVAGLHLGIIAFFVYALARRARFGMLAATCVTIAVACGYAWLADDGTPIWRATLMLAAYLLTRWLYRDRAALNAVGGAALALLLADPRALFDASFQLSFLAVFGIVAFALPLIEWTSAPYRRALHTLDALPLDLRLAPKQAQFRLDVRLIAHRVAVFVPRSIASALRSSPPRVATVAVSACLRGAFRLFELVLLSAVLQLILAAPMAFYFHRAVTLGVPANLLAVPAAGLLLPTGLVAIALSYMGHALAMLPAALASGLLRWVVGSVRWLAAGRLADIRVATPSMLSLIGMAGLVALAALLMRAGRKRAFAGTFLLVVTAIWTAVPQQRPALGRLEFTAIDVGQGDSLLLITPRGQTLLIDGGGPMGPFASDFDYGEEVVSAYLWSRGIARLDAVALTHAHQDHIGGLRAVVANFHPRELWIGRNPDVPAVRALLDQAARDGIHVVSRLQGESFDFGGAKVEVLAPAQDWQPAARPRNNDSLALRVSLGATAVLLPGDAERALERQLAGEPVSAAVLKVAHHGSNTSSTPQFLAAVRPQFAVISDGARNPFGHPRPAVLERLALAHAVTYRTDTMGAVTFILDGHSVSVTPQSLR